MFKYLNFSKLSKNKYILTLFRFLPIIILSSITTYVFLFGNIEQFVIVYDNISIYGILTIVALTFFKPLFDTLRWYVVFKIYHKSKFINLHQATIIGYSINATGITTVGVEASKLVLMKKITNFKNSFIILIIERLISAIIKVSIFVVALLVLFKETLTYKTVSLILSILLLLIFIYYMTIKNKLHVKINKILNDQLFIFFNYILKIKKNIIPILLIGFIAQIFNIFIYLVIIIVISIEIDFIKLFLIIPLIELSGQLALIFPSITDVSTVILFLQSNISLEMSLLIALIYKVAEFISIGLNTLLIETFKKVKH